MPHEEPPESEESYDEIAACLKDLAAGDDGARTRIIEICHGRLRELSSRLLGKFARVRRWDNTDDVAQNAALRLYRALAEVVPDSPRGLMGLMATQIQRELLDLARKHSGPMSYAANHDTNVREGSDGDVYVVEETLHEPEQDEELPLDRWESFHAAVEKLPEEHREVFKLAWYLGMTQTAVAEALGISRRTVQKRWEEAREKIRQQIDADSGGE